MFWEGDHGDRLWGQLILMKIFLNTTAFNLYQQSKLMPNLVFMINNYQTIVSYQWGIRKIYVCRSTLARCKYNISQPSCLSISYPPIVILLFLLPLNDLLFHLPGTTTPTP